jgi:hypothetical protein
LALGTRHINRVTYGRAAKLVAVYLKATVIIGGNWDTPFGRTMHPPIDRVFPSAARIVRNDRLTSQEELERD